MSIQAGRARLTQCSKSIKHQWEALSPHWQDANAKEMQQEVIDPLLSDAQSALRAMEEIAEVLHKIRRDCE